MRKIEEKIEKIKEIEEFFFFFTFTVSRFANKMVNKKF